MFGNGTALDAKPGKITGHAGKFPNKNPIFGVDRDRGLY
jgi:hypothetical protein